MAEFDFYDPKFQGLLTLASGLLAQSGWQPQRVGVGEAIGRSGIPAMQAMQQARRFQLEQEEAKKAAAMRDLQMKHLMLQIGQEEALPQQMSQWQNIVANIDQFAPKDTGLPVESGEPIVRGLTMGPSGLPTPLSPPDQNQIMRSQLLGPFAGAQFQQPSWQAQQAAPPSEPSGMQMTGPNTASMPQELVTARQADALYDYADNLEGQLAKMSNLHPKVQAAAQAQIKNIRDRAERLDKVVERRRSAQKVETEISADGTKQRNVMWNPQTQKYDIPIGGWRLVHSDKSLVDVKINTGESFWKEFGKGQAEFVNKQQEKAQQSSAAIDTIHNMRRNLDKGMFTGITGNVGLVFGRALSAAGFEGAKDPVANTQAYAAEAGNLVAQIIKEFGAGTGLSDADREYATKIAAGDITLDEKSLRKLLDIREKANRIVIKKYNKRIEQIGKKAGSEGIPFEMSVEEPPAYKLPSNGNKLPGGWTVEEVK